MLMMKQLKNQFFFKAQKYNKLFIPKAVIASLISIFNTIPLLILPLLNPTSLPLFFLRHFLSLFPSPATTVTTLFPCYYHHHSHLNLITRHTTAAAATVNNTSVIARALSHILSIVTDVPLTSRKYETIRDLEELLIDENVKEGSDALRRVNHVALTEAFARTISLLEDVAWKQARERESKGRGGSLWDYWGKKMMGWWVGNEVRVLMEAGPGWFFGLVGDVGRPGGLTAEKFGMELVWLVEKMAACKAVDEAIRRGGSASSLANSALSVEPRLQILFVKISALLLKHGRKMTEGDHEEERINDQQQKQRQKERTKMMKIMLVTWLPFLCEASNANGGEGPALSSLERMEVGKVIEEWIDTLKSVAPALLLLPFL